jgi:ATP synthase protein I
MKDLSLQNIRSKVKKIVYASALIVVLVALITGGFWGKQAGISAFLGGVAWSAPSFYFLMRVFYNKKKRTPGRIVFDFYTGEVVKLLLSAVLLIIIVKTVHPLVLPLLCGYIISLITFWMLSLFLLKS